MAKQKKMVKKGTAQKTSFQKDYEKIMQGSNQFVAGNHAQWNGNGDVFVKFTMYPTTQRTIAHPNTVI